MSKHKELREFFENMWDRMFGDLDQPSSTPSPSASPPWDPWELNPEFFAAMSRWTISHPESTLDRILDKLCIAIENGQPLLELIPDSPFPARGLIKGIIHLLQLGRTISQANREVHRFARQIIHWISELKAALEDGKLNRGDFTEKTKKNLEERRALVDEICVWATARLNDDRWLQSTEKLNVGDKIQEFNARMAAARELFMDLAMVNLSKGLDRILLGQRKISREIKLIRRLQEQQLSDINSKLDASKRAEDCQRFMDQMLQAYTVVNPTYDKQGKQPCDPDTRVEILEDIMTWVSDFSEDAKSFLWLTGDPGSGKSAITASLAKKFKDEGTLWAQFFINRNNDETTDPKSYFPTIARQMAEHFPDSEVSQAIHDTLKAKKSLVDDISREQALGLFVRAIEVASKLNPKKAVLVVIDGLDESNRSRLAETAKIFSTLFETLRCPNAKVFISSRTDDEIRRPFGQAYNAKYVKHIHLDTAAESSIRDVSTYMIRKVGEIVEDNELDWEEWPGEERMKALCTRASGLFIWAVTVVKFIQSQIRALGRERRNRLLDALSIKGMGDINVLYGTILQITYEESDEWEAETFRRVVGCIVVLREPLSIADLEAMLDLRETKDSDPVDILHLVRRLRTVLVAGADAIDEKTVPRLHKSFFEFITSDHAEPQLRVNRELSEGKLAARCLHQFNHRSISDVVCYAVRFWGLHLPQREQSSSGLAIAAYATLLPGIRELLLTSSLKIESQKPLGIQVPLDGLETMVSWDKKVTSWDPVTGNQLKWPILTENAISSLGFSPDGLRIVSSSTGGTIRLWDSKTGQAIGSAFKGHIDLVTSVALSPDGTQIVSSSRDKTIRLWDSQTGQAIGTAFEGHTDEVWTVAFSPDGARIVSGGNDTTLRLWNMQTGQAIGSALEGHTRYVQSVAFSPDGGRVVSCSSDKTIRLWDSQTGQAIGTAFEGHTDEVWTVAFSPDGMHVVSGSTDETIRLWNSHTGQAVGSAFRGHTGRVRSVAFSPDGTRIVSGGYDKTIRLWDSKTGEAIGPVLKGHTGQVQWANFSPDGMRIVSGGTDNTIRLWDSRTGRHIERVFKGHTSWIFSMTPFPSSSHVASASSDGKLWIWNALTGHPIGDSLSSNSGGFVSVTIPPDGSRIAAVMATRTIYLWDAESRKLISQVESSVDGITSLRFSPSGSEIILARVDGLVSRFTTKDGKLIGAPVSPGNHFNPENDNSFDMQQGWQRGASDTAILHWSPSEDPDARLWAYIDGMLIRSNGPDSVSIFDLAGKSETEFVATDAPAVPVSVKMPATKSRGILGKGKSILGR